jgi:broad specificity phosphatase PhoE
MIEIHLRHGAASAETGWSLTEEGKRQTEAAATYLRTHFPEAFSVSIHSGSRRAIETAQLLGLSSIKWVKDERLHEGDWQGKPVPREFKLWKDMYIRVSAACKEWDTQGTNQNRIIVSHGGTMQMVRAYREGLIDSRFHLLFEEPRKYFTNCQIVIYTDEDPHDRTINHEKLWVKSVCPWDSDRLVMIECELGRADTKVINTSL